MNAARRWRPRTGGSRRSRGRASAPRRGCSIEHEQRQQDHGGDRGRRSSSGSFQPEMPAARDAEHEAGEADDEREPCRAGRGRATSSAAPSSRRTSARPERAERAPSGTLNQNTQCQEIATSAPPSTGPITRPTAATIVFVPIARPSCSRGNASVTSAAALANRNAPPMPCRIRHRISSVPSAEKPAPSEASAKSDEAGDVGAACGRTGPTAGPAVSTSTVEAIM